MAQVGTVAGTYDQYRNFNLTISGFVLGSASNTPPFRSLGFVIGSWALTGTLVSASVQLQGSNDGVNWFNLGTAATQTGIYGLTGANTSSSNVVPVFYRFLDAGSGDTGTATITVTLMSTFG